MDEADVMIATQGHQDQSIRIQKNLSTDCQMMLFSATYDQDVMNFAENIISNPVVSTYIFIVYVPANTHISDWKWSKVKGCNTE